MFDADSFRIAVQEELKKYGYWYDLETGGVGERIQILILSGGVVCVRCVGYELTYHWYRKKATVKKVVKKVRKVLRHPPVNMGPPGPPGPPGPMGPACKCSCKCGEGL